MEQFITSIGDWISRLIDVLDNVQLWGVFSLFDFLFGALVLSLVIAIFWKGAGS